MTIYENATRAELERPMELTLTLSSIEPIVPIYLVTVISTLKPTFNGSNYLRNVDCVLRT